MFVLTFKFNRKTAAFIVIMAALVLIGIILLAGALEKKDAADHAAKKVVTTVNSEKSRCAYLAQYGWEVETPAMAAETVLIPRSFSRAFEDYNELQKSQGFDLSEYGGLEAELYTYRVCNYPGSDTVLAQLYVFNGCVIGGDIHSTALDGFMVGIKPGNTTKKAA